MHIKIIDGVPQSYTVEQLRKDNPNTSFSKNLLSERLAEYGMYEVKLGTRPKYNHLVETIKLLEPTLVGSQWTQQWEVVALSEERQLENLEEARATAYREESDPLFFKYQRGELDKQVWLDKVAEIKARYPKDN